MVAAAAASRRLTAASGYLGQWRRSGVGYYPVIGATLRLFKLR
jgi:hypothetical protein